jgi:hypothetical protein
VIHLARLIGGWSVRVDGWEVPMWASVISVAAAGLLSFAGFWSVRQIHRFLS